MSWESTDALPPDFVDVAELVPSILIELRYAGSHNFVGRPIAGYTANRAILTEKAALALRQAQQLALAQGYTLKVYDAFRPYRASRDFVAWGADSADLKMKAEFYPNLEKEQVFDGYLAVHSGHNRGSTVDVTLVALPVFASAAYRDGQKFVSGTAPYGVRFGDNSVDMGTGFDVLDEAAHTANVVPGSEPAKNRALLQQVMAEAGFENYRREWWHYALKDEPFADTFFDFPTGCGRLQ